MINSLSSRGWKAITGSYIKWCQLSPFTTCFNKCHFATNATMNHENTKIPPRTKVFLIIPFAVLIDSKILTDSPHPRTQDPLAPSTPSHRADLKKLNSRSVSMRNLTLWEGGEMFCAPKSRGWGSWNASTGEKRRCVTENGRCCKFETFHARCKSI